MSIEKSLKDCKATIHYIIDTYKNPNCIHRRVDFGVDDIDGVIAELLDIKRKIKEENKIKIRGYEEHLSE